MKSIETKTICIDIDGTICSQESPENYSDAIPLDGAIDTLKKIKKEGFNIVLFTARHFNHWETTKKWLKKYNIVYDQIVFGKPTAIYYVDDRAINFNGNWNDVFNKIK